MASERPAIRVGPPSQDRYAMLDAVIVTAFASTALKAAIPGPSAVLVTTAAARGGVASGASAAAGVMAANMVFIVAGIAMADAGVALSDRQFEICRWTGVALALLLAARMVLLAARDRDARFSGGDFAAGLGVALASPHNLVFYVVLAPPILTNSLGDGDGARIVVAAGAALLGVIVVNAALILAGASAHRMTSATGRRTARWFDYAGAGLIVAFAGILARGG